MHIPIQRLIWPYAWNHKLVYSVPSVAILKIINLLDLAISSARFDDQDAHLHGEYSMVSKAPELVRPLLHQDLVRLDIVRLIG
jgi:hypothetical protein